MAELHPVAWMRFRSFHGTGRATSVHLTEDHQTALCGRDVPRQARPGHRGEGIFQNVFPMDCNDPTEWDLASDDKAGIPHCQACLARMTSLDRLSG